MNSKTLLRLAGLAGVLALTACSSAFDPKGSCTWNGEGSQDENVVCIVPQGQQVQDAQ
jgi:hypothetical protein